MRTRKPVPVPDRIDPAKAKRRKGKAWMRGLKRCRGRVLGAKREDGE